MAKFKIEINNEQNIREILQVAYNLADEQIIQSQNEINKIVNSTQLHTETMDSKSKYGKIISDFMSIKDKAIAKKMEIAKLLAEILNRTNGSNGVMGDKSVIGKQSLDLTKIKEMVKNMHNDQEKTKTIELNKK